MSDCELAVYLKVLVLRSPEAEIEFEERVTLPASERIESQQYEYCDAGAELPLDRLSAQSATGREQGGQSRGRSSGAPSELRSTAVNTSLEWSYSYLWHPHQLQWPPTSPKWPERMAAEETRLVAEKLSHSRATATANEGAATNGAGAVIEQRVFKARI